MIRIAILDDHEALREGIRGYLTQQRDLQVVLSTADPSDLDVALEAAAVNVLLLDIGITGFNAIQAVQSLKRKLPQLKIVIVSADHKQEYVLQLIEAGIDGYCLKIDGLKSLAEAIHDVVESGGWFSQKIGTIATRHQQGLIANRLTEREVKVLRMLAEGKNTEEIAELLIISHRTAQTHINNILDKLTVKNRTQAVVKAIELGILDSKGMS